VDIIERVILYNLHTQPKENNSKRGNKRNLIMSKRIFVVPHNHFDPVWRRCFDRPSMKHGITVQSYADIEEAVIERFLELAKSGYPFSEGQAVVWRKYLERHPDKEQQIRQLVKQGRIELSLAGETVQDSNLPMAEGLIRNFLLSLPLYQKLADEDHPGLKIAWVEDAFGQTPNYPQILRGVGANVVSCTSYRVCEEDIWVGLDGTGIHCIDTFPRMIVGCVQKQPPCSECNGKGCSTCNDTGLTFNARFNMQELRESFDRAIAHESDSVAIWLVAEEMLPDERVLSLVFEYNEKYQGQCQFEIVTPGAIYEAYLPVIKKSALVRDNTPTPELNPVSSGCYVSRIKTKQRTREIGYLLVAAEGRIATEGWQQGRVIPLPEELIRAWHHVTFNQFHDAITGTHIDSAYTELMEMLDEAESVGKGLLPAVRVESQSEEWQVGEQNGEVQWGPYKVTFDREGILSILIDGQDLFGNRAPHHPSNRTPRIGELWLENDTGDAWGTRIPPFVGIDGDLHQIPLGQFNEHVRSYGQALRWSGRYSGGDPSVQTLAWTTTVRLSKDQSQLEFDTEVEWDTRSRRLRAMFPVNSDDPVATFEVPFGFIDRTFENEKLDYSQFPSNTMDFPALHWVHKEIGKGIGIALFNRGLPSYRWVPGRLDLSLLRSPEWGCCIVEPASYEFWDFDGQRDSGTHRFEYSLLAHTEPIAMTELTRMGYVYNRANDFKLPFEVKGDVIVTAWKPTQNGDQWLLRVQEANGTDSPLSINFGMDVIVQPCNLVEKPIGQKVLTNKYDAILRKHQIKSLTLNRNGEQ
jgi:hypothetical protein